jgi:hypothetical protein
MSMLWSTEQQRCLAALGFAVYRTARNDAATNAAPIDGECSPLTRALLRAAGLDPAQVQDPSSWLQTNQVPELSQLRGNPAAKRDLWPCLRTLRRTRAGR